MAIPVLVMTPIQSFGEVIREALQEADQYIATIVHDNETIFEEIRDGDYPVAVLDLGLEPNLFNLISSLNQLDQDLRIIVIKDRPYLGKESLKDLNLVKIIDGIFRMPELLDALDKIASELKNEAELIPEFASTNTSFPSQVVNEHSSSIPPRAPAWLREVNRVAQTLTRLLLESDAHAALINRRADLWAYAGHLARPAAQELAQSVWNYWDHDGRDLARYVHLKINNGEYMLYATGLGGDFILTLAFEIATPFSVMRREANKLAERLSTLPSRRSREDEIDTPVLDSSADPALINKSKQEEAPSDDPLDMQLERGSEEDDQVYFENMLAAVEIPDPDGKLSVESDKEGHRDIDRFEGVREVDNQDVPAPVQTRSMDAAGTSTDLQVSGSEDQDSFVRSTPKKRYVAAAESFVEEVQHLQSNPTENSRVDELVDNEVHFSVGEHTRISDISPGGENVSEPQEPTSQPGSQASQVPRGKLGDLNPGESVFHNLSYACLLVPRMPEHQLVGDVVSLIKGWADNHALAFGWSLEHLSIQPDHLHWIALLSPDFAPGQMVFDLRNHASQLIFSEFPRFKRENPSGDFWAPGYLVTQGKTPLPAQLVADFIKKIRGLQGISTSQSSNINH